LPALSTHAALFRAATAIAQPELPYAADRAPPASNHDRGKAGVFRANSTFFLVYNQDFQANLYGGARYFSWLFPQESVSA
jgi:hypothetical protein